MKIISITLGGFKGINEKAVLPLAPITLFFGANSTGKSTILHGLLYLYEVLVNRNPDPEYSSLIGDKLYFGGFKNLVHGKDEAGVITLGLSLDMSEEGGALDNYLTEAEEWMVEKYIQDYPEAIADTWGFEIEIAWSTFDKKPYIRKYSVDANGELFCVIERKSGGKISYINYLKLIDSWVMPEAIESITQYFGENWQAVPIHTYDHALPNYDKRLSLVSYPWDWSEIFPDHPLSAATFCEASISQACLGPLQTLSKYLKNLFHIGPIRVVPGRCFVTQTTTSAARWYDGSGAWDRIAYGDDMGMLLNSINAWFKQDFGFNSPYEFKVVTEGEENIPSKRVLIKQRDWGVFHSLNEVGVGISQVVPFMAGVLKNEDCVLMCEQPELHIHPRWQLVLADMMLSQINMGYEKLFLVETHSEHIMLRLLKRRRETAENALDNNFLKCTVDEVQVIFCEQVDGRTRLLPIATTDEGEFDAPWPNGFFKERRDELI